MSDLISRGDAIELVRDVCDAIMSGCDSYYDAETGDEGYYICSKCGAKLDSGHTNFCLNCGVDMRGEEE